MKINNIFIIVIALFVINCKGNNRRNDTVEKDTLTTQHVDSGTENKGSINRNRDNLKIPSQSNTVSNNIADEAKNYFNQGIQLLQKRGFFLTTKRDTQTYLKAANYIKKAIEHDSNYVNAYTNLAQIYYKLDSNNLALDVLNSLLKVKPNYVEAITTKGFVLEKMSKQEKANHQYKKALQIYSFKLDKTYSDYINKAFLSLLLYGEKEGLKELEMLNEKYPDKDIEKYIVQFKNFNRQEFINNALN